MTSELEKVNLQTGEVIQSPWHYTENGTPLFISDSYEEHVQEWMNKEQEGKKVLWEMSAISNSLIGRCLGRSGDNALADFAATVGTGTSRLHQLGEAHSLRVELEQECSTRVEHLPEALTLHHYFVVARNVRNRTGSNVA